MLKLIKFILWILVILAICVGFDRMMFALTMTAPGLKETQEFYVDFRQRLTGLFAGSASTGQSVEGLIGDSQNSPAKEQLKRYLYVDDFGEIHFTDSLKEVPARYRERAQPMAN